MSRQEQRALRREQRSTGRNGDDRDGRPNARQNAGPANPGQNAQRAGRNASGSNTPGAKANAIAAASRNLNRRQRAASVAAQRALARPSQAALRALPRGVLGANAFARNGRRGAALRNAAVTASLGALATRSYWRRDWTRHRPLYGFAGPVFWPYAYDDIYYDAFWPGEYDDPFWSYGYNEIYTSLFSPSGYDDYAYAQARGSRGTAGKTAARDAEQSTPTPGTTAYTQMCGDDTKEIAAWPIDRIQEVVQPNEDQLRALDALADASADAAQGIKTACPVTSPITPVARLDAMDQRVSAMLRATEIVAPKLDAFYNALNDDQKARLNAMGQSDDQRGAGQNAARPTALNCGLAAAQSTEWPAARIDRAVKPTAEQRDKLDALTTAAGQAADTLKAACPSETPITPPARIEAMGKRLQAMRDALRTVRGALDTFYGSLSDEQKAQFDLVGRADTGRG